MLDGSSIRNLKLPAGPDETSGKVQIVVEVYDYLGDFRNWTYNVTVGFLII